MNFGSNWNTTIAFHLKGNEMVGKWAIKINGGRNEC